MSRTFGLSMLATAVVLGLTVMAQERPTQEHQDIMKSNAAILAVTGLRAHITAKDYDAIVKDATTLKTNFEKIETFWIPRKVEDAIKFAKAGVKAAIDLETAANAKDARTGAEGVCPYLPRLPPGAPFVYTYRE